MSRSKTLLSRTRGCGLLGFALMLGWAGWSAATSTIDRAQIVNGGLDAPTQLAAKAWCSPIEPGIRLTRFNWEPAVDQGELRIEIANHPLGLLRGHVETIGPIKAGTSSVVVEGGLAGTSYTWRVLRQTGNGWVASLSQRISAPICKDDRKTELPSAERALRLNGPFRRLDAR